MRPDDTSAGNQPPADDPVWRDVLTGKHPDFRLGRRFFKLLPSAPRCKLCAAPFRGAASPFMRLIGKAPWPNNPKYCGSCLAELTEHHGGAEIECSLLFADVRGSTALAEAMPPAQFRALMERFFDVLRTSLSTMTRSSTSSLATRSSASSCRRSPVMPTPLGRSRRRER